MDYIDCLDTVPMDFATSVFASFEMKPAAPACCRLDSPSPRTPPAHRDTCSTGVREQMHVSGKQGRRDGQMGCLHSLAREIEGRSGFLEDRVDKSGQARGSLWRLIREESGSNRRSLRSRAGAVESGPQIGEGPRGREIDNAVTLSGTSDRGTVKSGALS